MRTWTDFFTALAIASATSFAVVLATLQICAPRWERTALRRVAAVLPLIDLLVPAVAALVSLLPGDPSWRVGYLVMGAVGLTGRGWYVAGYMGHEDAADDFELAQLRVGVPVSVAVYVAMIAFACKGGDTSLYVLAGLSVWLLVSGAAQAWLLLTPRQSVEAPEQSVGSDLDQLS